ncbi:MAG: hypothetical protein HY901_26635 [Deltaproteobacteria bacterium]|nr:hypothetical protein [Deltaproteobacteria bacterium]
MTRIEGSRRPIAMAASRDVRATKAEEKPASFRLIEGSRSPDGRYAIGWGFASPNVDFGSFRQQDGSFGTDLGAAELHNFIVDCRRNVAVAETPGTHPGDRKSYNHNSNDVTWSSNSKYLVQLNNSKWETGVGSVYSLDSNGKIAGPADLLAAARMATKELGQQHLSTDDYAVSLTNVKVSDNGLVRCTLVGEIPRGEGFQAEVLFKSTVDSRGKLSLKLQGAAQPVGE